MVFSEFIRLSFILLLIGGFPFWMTVFKWTVNVMKVIGVLLMIFGMSITLPWDGYGGFFDQLGATGYVVAIGGLVVFSIGFSKVCGTGEKTKDVLPSNVVKLRK